MVQWDIESVGIAVCVGRWPTATLSSRPIFCPKPSESRDDLQGRADAELASSVANAPHRVKGVSEPAPAEPLHTFLSSVQPVRPGRRR